MIWEWELRPEVRQRKNQLIKKEEKGKTCAVKKFVHQSNQTGWKCQSFNDHRDFFLCREQQIGPGPWLWELLRAPNVIFWDRTGSILHAGCSLETRTPKWRLQLTTCLRQENLLLLKPVDCWTMHLLRMLDWLQFMDFHQLHGLSNETNRVKGSISRIYLGEGGGGGEGERGGGVD